MRKSARNLQACTEVGLIERILTTIHDKDDMQAGTNPQLTKHGTAAFTTVQCIKLSIFFRVAKRHLGNFGTLQYNCERAQVIAV